MHFRTIIRRASRVFLLLLGIAVNANSFAGDQISDYFAGLTTIQSQFEQSVVDSNGQTVQNSQGRVWIQRPGRFRWDYETPYRQLIVADGNKLWTYDEDLEQATVKPIDDALSSTPAMLLSGFRPLSEVMTWKKSQSDDGRNWYRLDPKQADSAVEKVRIAFEEDQLTIIEVIDGFGNHTRIRFSNIVRNTQIDPSLFTIRLPPDTDIIGDSP
ncbi:outer membrane lipoprotein chaperone LolA [Thiogranum longum]